MHTFICAQHLKRERFETIIPIYVRCINWSYRENLMDWIGSVDLANSSSTKSIGRIGILSAIHHLFHFCPESIACIRFYLVLLKYLGLISYLLLCELHDGGMPA